MEALEPRSSSRRKLLLLGLQKAGLSLSVLYESRVGSQGGRRYSGSQILSGLRLVRLPVWVRGRMFPGGNCGSRPWVACLSVTSFQHKVWHRVPGKYVWMSVSGEGWNVCLQPTLLPLPCLLLTQRADITLFPREGGPTHNCLSLPHPY